MRAREVFDHDGFVRCVSAIANRTQAIECGNAERGGEVSVGCATGGGFSEREAQLRGERLGVMKEADRATKTFHGRAVDPPSELERAALVFGLEAGEFAHDARAVCGAGDAHVDFCEGMCGNDIGFGAALSDANANGEAALEIGPAADGLDDVR